jgi:hypothetical protein
MTLIALRSLNCTEVKCDSNSLLCFDLRHALMDNKREGVIMTANASFVVQGDYQCWLKSKRLQQATALSTAILFLQFNQPPCEAVTAA